jgi:hypothetical protein
MIMSREIHKVSLKKDKFQATYRRTRHLEGEGEIPYKEENVLTSEIPVHRDLKQRMDNLRIHLGLIGEFGQEKNEEVLEMLIQKDTPDTVYLDEFVEGLTVTGIVLGGDELEGTDGVQIVGYKTLKTGKVLNFTTPFVKFDSDTSDYAHATILEADVARLVDEANLFISGEKNGVAQMEMKFDSTKSNPDLVDQQADK